MKKIAIVTRKMITGGVERALITMLRQFDYREVQIDLYLEFLGGELFDEIPDEVNCIQIPSIRGLRAACHPVQAAKKLLAMVKLRVKRRPYIEQCCLYSQMLQPVREKYDVAIAYHAPNTVPMFYVIDGIRAEKKILWLHGDLDTNAGDTAIARRYHNRYDKVFAVSRYARDSFVKRHPQKAAQAEVFHNFVDMAAIRKKAEVGPAYDDDFDGPRILSIGRLDHQKGFDMAITACRMLVDRGYRFRWYICGEGNARAELEQMIRDNRLEGTFVLLGNQLNPYGYLRACDLYVQPSRFEGYCTTTNEARVLRKPVITTAVSGADEQFEDGITGWIVPIDARAIADKIADCLEHPAEMARVERQLEKIQLQPDGEIRRIFE